MPVVTHSECAAVRIIEGETSPHLSIYFQAEPPIRERKNKVESFGNECRLRAATCGLVHFDDNIQRSPAKSPQASRIQPARRPGEPMEEYRRCNLFLRR